MGGIDGNKKWEVVEADKNAVEAIIAATGVTRLAARVMAARGITAKEAPQFLEPSLERDWISPYCIPGMEEGVARIERAIQDQEKIAVFGDFDVDGLSATTVMTYGLRALGATVDPFIPRRFDEGYGLSEDALRRVIAASHPSLIITVDTGIAAKDEVTALVENGIDVVVTDHHEPSDKVPTDVPVIDPKLDDTCPSHELAGVGVALKVICALGEKFGRPDLWRSLTDIATLGTISDMMPLDAENRAIVADGIDKMRESQRYGLIALAAYSNTDLQTISADELSYSLIPRLNAAGRIADPKLGLDLLMVQDPIEADILAERLEAINQERREIESELTDAAMAMVDATYDGGRIIVIGGEGWHEGVKGIVASRIVNKYKVPALLFTISDGVARGSGRTVGQIDLFKVVEQCSDLLIQFGGHAGAVGVTLDAANLDALRERLEGILAEYDQEDFEARGTIDAQVELVDMNLPEIQSLDLLRPFGQGNRVPLFVVRGVVMESRARVGREGEHLRFVATDGKYNVPCIMFRAPNVEALAEYPGAVDIVFEAVAEVWQGRTNPKLMVKDIIMRTYMSKDEPQARELVESLFSQASEIVRKDEFFGISDALRFHTKVAGVTFEGRPEVLRTLHSGDKLQIVREKTNEYDENAIAVFTEDGRQVGYLNRHLAKALAPVMDEGAAYSAEVTEVTGGNDKEYGLNILVIREQAGDKDKIASLTQERKDTRERLAQLSPEELTDTLRKTFIGEHSFLPAQQEALDYLAAGNSTLCVMATGRGKSLIFHVHAARTAILHNQASVFIYPLRALVADQEFHLNQAFSQLGLTAKVLTGETSLDEREAIFAGLADGKVDMILTTPEFFTIHYQKFAATHRIGFVVVDEAHHAGMAKGGHRVAYNDLDTVLKALGNPEVLAVTATASTEVAQRIQELLFIDKVVIDPSVRENLLLDDGRGTRDRDARLVSVVASGEKTIIYVNSREQSVSIAAMLRKRIWELGSRIAFYNAGLKRSDRDKVEAAFRSGELCCIVSTSAFGEGVNLPDVRHVILYHMPFGAVEFNQMSGRAGRDNEDAWVHLLFGPQDARINERILSGAAPERADLATLYRGLTGLAREAAQEGEESFSKTNADIAAYCLDINAHAHLDERAVSCGIAVFRELKFLTTTGYGSSRRITMVPSPQRMELDSSIRYLEGMRSKEDFGDFKEWILNAPAGEVLERFNRPIIPALTPEDSEEETR